MANESERLAYAAYFENEVEDYKNSVSRSHLLGIADQAVTNLRVDVSEGGGGINEKLLAEEVDSIIAGRLRIPSFRAWQIRRLTVSATSTPTLLDSIGRPVNSESAAAGVLLVQASEISEELIRCLASKPELLHALDPRKFEELVAELLRREGLEVSLTQATRDGGKDLIVATSTAMGSFVYYVECKKYAPDRPVGVRIVRELFGVIEAEHVTGGVVVTTSSFTTEALKFREKVPHQLSLRGYEQLVAWLRSRSGRDS